MPAPFYRALCLPELFQEGTVAFLETSVLQLGCCWEEQSEGELSADS